MKDRSPAKRTLLLLTLLPSASRCLSFCLPPTRSRNRLPATFSLARGCRENRRHIHLQNPTTSLPNKARRSRALFLGKDKDSGSKDIVGPDFLTVAIDTLISLFSRRNDSLSTLPPAGYFLIWLYLACAAPVPQFVASIALYAGFIVLAQQFDTTNQSDDKRENNNNNNNQSHDEIVLSSTQQRNVPINGERLPTAQSDGTTSDDHEQDDWTFQRNMLEPFCFVASLALGAILTVGKNSQQDETTSVLAWVTNTAATTTSTTTTGSYEALGAGPGSWIISGLSVILVAALGAVVLLNDNGNDKAGSRSLFSRESSSSATRRGRTNADTDLMDPGELMMQQWDKEFQSRPPTEANDNDNKSQDGSNEDGSKNDEEDDDDKALS